MKLIWHNRSIKYTQEEIDIAVLAMQEALPLTQGKYLDLFEKRFEEYCVFFFFGINKAASRTR